MQKQESKKQTEKSVSKHNQLQRYAVKKWLS